MATFQWRPDRRCLIASAGAVIGGAACAAKIDNTRLELDFCHASDRDIRRLISFRRKAAAWALGADGRVKRFAAEEPRLTAFGLMLEGVIGKALLPADSFRVESSGNHYCSGGSCALASRVGGFPEGRRHISDGWAQGALAYYVPSFSSTDSVRVQVWFTEADSGRVFHEFAREGRSVLRIEGAVETPEVTAGEAWSIVVDDNGAFKMLSYCFSPGTSAGFCEFKTGAGSSVKGQSIVVLGTAASTPSRYLFAPHMGEGHAGGDVAVATGALAHLLAAPIGAMVIECSAVQWPGAILGDPTGRLVSLVASGPTTLSAYERADAPAIAAAGGWRGLSRVALAWDETGWERCFNGGAIVRSPRPLSADARMRLMPSAVGYLRRISAVARPTTSGELRRWTQI